jgi:hypothetical protein
MKTLYFIIMLIFICINQIFGMKENTVLKQIIAVRTEENIKIDGILSEDIWQRPGDSNLIQQEPVQGVKPSQQSKYWFAYDDAAIYFAVKYYDNKPDSIMARLVRRDFIWGDPSDGCVLYLDPYNDDRNGYFFYVSAAGTLADGLIENDVKQPNDLTWDAVWEGVANIDSEGWSVEMKIPFSQLRFKESDIQVWGVDVERFISRAAETDMVAYTPRNENGFVSRFPDLVGIEGIKPSARFELLPYITGKGEYIGNDTKDPFNPGHKYLPGVGLDMKAGLGRSLILDGTINPDFGQVELDPAVVNLTDVETSFQEKRPFFTEGVTIFRFGRGGTNNNLSFNWPTTNIFYSRRIGRTPQGRLPDYNYADIPNGTHILGAGKISGQIGDWKVGMIHALTQRESAEIELEGQRSNIEVEPLTYYGVLRAQRDFDAGQQGIGILSTFTNRFFKDDNLRNTINKDALVVGADGYSFLDNDRTYVVTGWAALSDIRGNKDKMIALQRGSGHYFQRPDVSYIRVDSSATSMTGYAGRVMLNKNRGSFIINTALGFLSPKFEINDLGYESYSDIINAHFAAGYRWNTPTEYYQNIGISAATYFNFDFGGNKTMEGYWTQGFINFSNLYGGYLTYIYNPTSYNSRRTRGGPLTLNPVSQSYDLYLYTDNRLWWVFTIDGFINNGGGVDTRSVTATLEFKLSPTLTFSFGPYLSKDIFQAQWIGAYTDQNAIETYGKRYIFAHLNQTTVSADIRADWILSPKLSFQVYLQPYIVSGKYNEFKTLQKPKTFDFMNYGENGSTLEKNIGENGEISYTLDPDGQGTASAKTISNPDFNYISLRGNVVLRWEYMPGSALYLVWTQSREGIESNGDFRFGRSMDNLVNVKPDNIFMLKATYWLGM